MQALGTKSRLIYGEESTFGTAPSFATTHSIMLPFISESLGQKQNQLLSNVIQGNRNYAMPLLGNRDVSGTVKTELNPYMHVLLKHMLGSVTSDTGTHTFKVGALPTGLTVEKGITDLGKYFLYTGCKINKANFTLKSEGFVEVDFDFMGKKRVVGNASADSAPVNLGHTPFSGYEAVLTEGAGGTYATDLASVTDFTFSIENDLDGGQYTIPTGSTLEEEKGTRQAIPEGRIKVSGKLTCLFDSTDLMDKATSSTETGLKLVFTKGTGVGTAGNELLEFYFPELKFEANDPGVSGPKGIMLELPFSAYYNDDADASSMKIILKNSISTF